LSPAARVGFEPSVPEDPVATTALDVGEADGLGLGVGVGLGLGVALGFVVGVGDDDGLGLCEGDGLGDEDPVGQIIRVKNVPFVITGLLKSAVFACLIGTIACDQGLNTSDGAEGVGRSTTKTVVLCVIFTLLMDLFLTQFVQLWLKKLIET